MNAPYSVSIWKVQDDGSKIEKVINLNISGCIDYLISPKAGYLATYEKFSNPSTSASASSDQQQLNYSIWKLDFEDGSAEKKLAFSHKNQSTWTPQWTCDDSLIGRSVNGEVHFYTQNDVDNKKCFPSSRIILDSLNDFLICPSLREFKCATFAKESKGRPGSIRIYSIATLNEEIIPNHLAQKTFFKADRCQFRWSPNGRNLLALISTEVDKTGKSYYGESNLYFLAADGKFDCRVDLSGGGPIHSFTWSPLGTEFIVIHGFMPATTSLFDLKCKQVYDFTCGSKNEANYNAAGNLIAFGGFGNLPGTIEIWRRTGAVSRVGAMQSVGTTVMEWSADGSILLTAVLTPRLRVDNGFKLWSMTGELLHFSPYNELYQVIWAPCDSSRFAAPKIDSSVGSSSSSSQTISATGELKKEAYRPPSLRNKTSSLSSKTSSVTPSPPPPPVSLPSSISKEARTVRRIQEKLTSIAAIKAKLAAGENLEPEQIEKMAREGEIQKELEKALEALKLSQ
jgi:translation initiation factor 2A